MKTKITMIAAIAFLTAAATATPLATSAVATAEIVASDEKTITLKVSGLV